MEKIEKFKDCKVVDLQSIKGGRQYNHYATESSEGTVSDKQVNGNDGKFIKIVTNTDSWFNRDNGERL